MKKISSLIIGGTLAVGAIMAVNPSMVVTLKNGDIVKYGLSDIEHVTFDTDDEEDPGTAQRYKTTVSELWTKTGAELSLQFPSMARDICVSGDYLLVLDNTIGYDATAKIKAYNKLTGEFVKDVAIYEGGWNGPRSYTWTLAADEAGHFAMGRLNSGGAGFWMDAYKNIDAMPVNPFKLAANQVPENAGKRMQLLGDIFSGEGYVCLTSSHFYGVIPMDGQYCTWNMNDGVPTTTEPEIHTFPSRWYSAIVQRESLADPTMYVTYNDETGYPSDPADMWNNLHGAHFSVVDAEGNFMNMDPNYFSYRILDANVFSVKNARYYFTLQMGYSTGSSPMSTALYDITTDEPFAGVPSAADFNNYKLYESEGYVSANDNRIGSVTVSVDNENATAYLYAFYPGETAEKAKITCIKVVLGDPIN